MTTCSRVLPRPWRRRTGGPVFAGLRGGVGRLPAALAEASGAEIRTGAVVRDIERAGAGWMHHARRRPGTRRRRRRCDAGAGIGAAAGRCGSRSGVRARRPHLREHGHRHLRRRRRRRADRLGLPGAARRRHGRSRARPSPRRSGRGSPIRAAPRSERPWAAPATPPCCTRTTPRSRRPRSPTCAAPSVTCRNRRSGTCSGGAERCRSTRSATSTASTSSTARSRP